MGNAEQKPIIFLLGPSGVGKSTVGEMLRSRFDFLFVDVDAVGEVDPIDREGLRGEWSAFLHQADARPLVSTIRKRMSLAAGAILSFPSTLVLLDHHIFSAAATGIATVLLYASGAECVDAFVTRERHNGRRLGVDHWIANNAMSYAVFSSPRFDPYRIPTHVDGHFRDAAAIAREVRSRAH